MIIELEEENAPNPADEEHYSGNITPSDAEAEGFAGFVIKGPIDLIQTIMERIDTKFSDEVTVTYRRAGRIPLKIVEEKGK
ncbi:MAG: hypothetical protein WCK39_02025 [Methanomassiliicoccales archaeon]